MKVLERGSTYEMSVGNAVQSMIDSHESYETVGIEKKQNRTIELIGKLIEKLADKNLLSVVDVQDLLGGSWSHYDVKEGEPE